MKDLQERQDISPYPSLNIFMYANIPKREHNRQTSKHLTLQVCFQYIMGVFNDGSLAHFPSPQVQPQSALVEVLGHSTDQFDEVVDLFVNSLTYQVCLQCLQYQLMVDALIVVSSMRS